MGLFSQQKSKASLPAHAVPTEHGIDVGKDVGEIKTEPQVQEVPQQQVVPAQSQTQPKVQKKKVNFFSKIKTKLNSMKTKKQ